MKKLVYPKNANAPFWLRDLEYMQEGFEETLIGIIKGLSFDRRNFIISGCEIIIDEVSKSVAVNAGWAYYEGEILPVLSRNFALSGFRGVIYFETVTQKSGTRFCVQENGEKRVDVYINDALIPMLETPINNRLAITPKTWNLSQRIAHMTIPDDSGWVNVKLPTLEAPAGYGKETNVKYRRIGNMVQLFGQIVIQNKDCPIKGVGLPKPLENMFLTRRLFSDNSQYVAIEIGTANLEPIAMMNTSSFCGTLRLDDIVYLCETNHDSIVSDGQVVG